MYEHERQRVLLELDTLGIDFRTPEEQASRLVDEMSSICPNCGKPLDAFQMCRDVDPLEAAIGIRFCSAGWKFQDHPAECGCERCANMSKLEGAWN